MYLLMRFGQNSSALVPATVLHIFDILIFHYFLQLIFRLTSAAKSNEKFVSKKLCNTVLILDALYLCQATYEIGYFL